MAESPGVRVTFKTDDFRRLRKLAKINGCSIASMIHGWVLLDLSDVEGLPETVKAYAEYKDGTRIPKDRWVWRNGEGKFVYGGVPVSDG